MLFGISWQSVLRTISQILNAGVAITAFSLLLFSLVFNLRERVVRSFLMILVCVTIVYTSEAIASASQRALIIEIFLKSKWVGIVFLPPTYLHFSHTLMTLTGQPSRGSRLWAVRFTTIFAFVLVVLIPLDFLIGRFVDLDLSAHFLSRNILTDLFVVYYSIVMSISGYNLYRAFQRTVTKTSRRRMIYLLAGATAAAVGIFPYLIFGPDLFAMIPNVFWMLTSISSLGVMGFIVIMTYSVAFFGVSWPDRVIKTRLFKWFLRGPFTASLTLAITTITRRLGEIWGEQYSAFVPIFMVGMIIFIEYLITLLAPFWERLLFYGSDRKEIVRIQSLENHLLTRSELSQFLEIVTAMMCDLMQVEGAFIASLEGTKLEILTTTGDTSQFKKIEKTDEIIELSLNEMKGNKESSFYWSGHLITPIVYEDPQNGDIILGLSGFPWEKDRLLEEEHRQSLDLLNFRVGVALRDWQMQQKVLSSMESLQPQVALIQQLRAASSYNKASVLLDEADLPGEDFIDWVKDALAHYWGGPKLSESPLLGLKVVKSVVNKHNGNPTNALRGILKSAIDRTKPAGERRFTAEWILYNILELKFLEGRKVRDVATRLSMSEADLYRKQRVALEAVAKVIIGMEIDAREKENNDLIEE
jgi:hypothetical protein